ncbi:Ubiquitin-protein ligase/ zinc ion binding protein [Pyrenophora teres f. maculata]|nr:Ubiquitin-protein ligase/ zinc ion binding protein [Pyrenophora teres f. maculata]
MLAISKEAFLNQHVVPATPHDKFNDNKCSFCWDKYNDGNHPAVRVLPCNHVFGRPCLLHMIEGANGHRCPICTTPFFRKSGVVTFDDIVQGTVEKIEAVSHQVLYLFDRLPTPLYKYARP